MRKGVVKSISLASEEESRELDGIAAELNFFRGGEPNVSALIQAIARRQIPLPPAEPLNGAAARALEFIKSKQPFRIAYHDAKGEPFQFTVRYGHIIFREKRNYLECWCDETDKNQDIPGLQHNWCLRLDRIDEDAQIFAVEGDWREEGMDEIDVEFKLTGGLASAYSLRPDDWVDTWIDGDRYVTRRIDNTFWFFRSTIAYGKDCTILNPPEVKQRFIEHLREALANYNE